MPNGGKLTLETANVHLDDRYAMRPGEVVPGQYVMLAVTDNGSGMTPEVKAKAFDPFFTTKDVGHGTGLGLSQVYGFVKQSRGHVKIYSEVGEGTTIKLYLPAGTLAASLKDEEAEVQSLPARTGAETVLVVEDDAGRSQLQLRHLARARLCRPRGGKRRSGPCAAGGKSDMRRCCSPTSACRAA